MARGRNPLANLRPDYMDASVQWWSDEEVAAYESGVVTERQVKRILSGAGNLTRAPETIRRRVYHCRTEHGRSPWRVLCGPSPFRHYRPQVEAYQEDGRPRGPFVHQTSESISD